LFGRDTNVSHYQINILIKGVVVREIMTNTFVHDTHQDHIHCLYMSFDIWREHRCIWGMYFLYLFLQSFAYSYALISC